MLGRSGDKHNCCSPGLSDAETIPTVVVVIAITGVATGLAF
jgi:hypothetical protein